MSQAEHELKLVLPPRCVGVAGLHLAAACRPDGEYPTNTVASIYFDTPRLDLIGEKINSDYIKTKVRVRWYEGDPRGPSPAFLEVKRRFGTRRRKIRRPIDLPGAELAEQALTHPALRRLPHWLAAAGVAVAAPLSPLLLVRYQRRRFVTAEGDRVSLDSGIQLGATDGSRLAPRAVGTSAGRAVVEIKGPRGRVPEALRFLYRLGARRDSFSKYGACYDLATGEAA